MGGRTRHANTRQLFLRDIKDQGIFQVNWISGDDNEVNFSTKTFPSPLFDKHHVKFNGEE